MIFILYFWVLPYVIGAVYFGIVVSRKMNEIEELELEKQRQGNRNGKARHGKTVEYRRRAA